MSLFSPSARGPWPALSGLCLALLLLAPQAFGQEGAGGEILRLSPQSAVELAIKNNLSLESARITLDTKKRKSDLFWNQFLPTLGVQGGMSRDNYPTTTSIPLAGSITLPRWHVNGVLSATMDISFALIEGIRQIKLDYETGIITMEKARLQLERSILQSYNNLLFLEAQVALQKETYANAELRAAAAEANFRAGLVPRLQWLQAQVEVENMRPGITDLENTLKSLFGNFAILLGLPYDTPLELEGVGGGNFSIPLDTAAMIQKAALEKPDIVELKAGIRTMESARKASALQLYTPVISPGWTLTSTFNPQRDPWKDSWSNGDNWNPGGAFSLTVRMSLNGLLPFTKEGQQLKDITNNLRAMNISLAQMIQATELEVSTKINSLEKIRASETVQKAAVELAELSYRLTEEAYRAGLQDYQSVRTAALALETAKLQLLKQQFDFLNDLLDLEYALGIPFGTLSSQEKN